MKRTSIIKASTAQNICIFCSCRLDPATILLPSVPKRRVSTSIIPRTLSLRLNNPLLRTRFQRSPTSQRTSSSEAWTPDPNSPLSAAEQREKHMRMEARRQEEAARKAAVAQNAKRSMANAAVVRTANSLGASVPIEKTSQREKGDDNARRPSVAGALQKAGRTRQSAADVRAANSPVASLPIRKTGRSRKDEEDARVSQTAAALLKAQRTMRNATIVRASDQREKDEEKARRASTGRGQQVIREIAQDTVGTMQKGTDRGRDPVLSSRTASQVTPTPKSTFAAEAAPPVQKVARPSFSGASQPIAPSSSMGLASGWGSGHTETKQVVYGDAPLERILPSFKQSGNVPQQRLNAPAGLQSMNEPRVIEPSNSEFTYQVPKVPQATPTNSTASTTLDAKSLEIPSAQQITSEGDRNSDGKPSVSQPERVNDIVPSENPQSSRGGSESTNVPPRFRGRPTSSGTLKSDRPDNSMLQHRVPDSEIRTRKPPVFSQPPQGADARFSRGPETSGWGSGSTYVAPRVQGESQSNRPTRNGIPSDPVASVASPGIGAKPSNRSTTFVPFNVRSPTQQGNQDSDGIYRTVLVRNEDLRFDEPAAAEDTPPSTWQHLRQKSANVPEAQRNDPACADPQMQRDDHIEQNFRKHVLGRPSAPPVYQPSTDTYNNYATKYTQTDSLSQRCGRCGQVGHIARDCPRDQVGREEPRPAPAYPQTASRNESQLAQGRDDEAGEDRRAKTTRFEAFRPKWSSEESAPTPRDSWSDDPPRARRVSYEHTMGKLDDRAFAEERPRGRRDRWATDVDEDDGVVSGKTRKDNRRDRWARDAEEDEAVSAGSKFSNAKSSRAGRSDRRDRYELDEEDDSVALQKASKGSDRKGARSFRDEDDESAADREEARARKQARQAERAAQMASERAAAQAEREARAAAKTLTVRLPEFVSVQNLSQALGVRYERFVDRLEELGYEDIFPGKIFNSEISGMIALEYNYEPIFETGVHEDDDRDLKALPTSEGENLPPRPPVVTIMGHVDHGKTTILDYIRKSSVAAGEAGGITQHIGAFSVPMTSSGKTITFLDTPGHEAFLAMRQRGANVTDIVILVVAADDSVKPQTIEAIKHAQAAKVPIIVAVNKIDKEEADIERCKQDVARHGIEIEDYGGDTQVVPVSGKTGLGMDVLEENIVTLSEILDHRASVDGQVEGWVIESSTKLSGRVATVLIRRGTLRVGDIIVAGKTWARTRTLKNEAGESLEEVGPGMPVEVDGWNEQPAAGDEVLQAPNEQKATSVVDFRIEKQAREQIAKDLEVINANRQEQQIRHAKDKAAKEEARRNANAAKQAGVEVDISQKTETQDENKEQQSGQQLIPFIIKADVSGSVEAVSAYVLGVSHPLIAPKILHADVGAIHESDVDLAEASKGHIIAFNLPTSNDIRRDAETKGVKILENNIIYRVLDDVKAVLEAALPPLITHKVTGEAEIGASFSINTKGRKYQKIAGCKIRNGSIKKGSHVRILRNGEKIYDGTITSLKNVKKDVEEMRKGSECGMGFNKWEEFEVGDQIQTYDIVSEKRYM